MTGLGQERGTDKPPPKGKQGPVTARGTNLPPPPPTEGRSVDEFTGDDPEFDFTDPDATPFDDPAAVMLPPEGEQGPVTGRGLQLGTNLPPPEEEQPVDDLAGTDDEAVLEELEEDVTHDFTYGDPDEWGYDPKEFRTLDQEKTDPKYRRERRPAPGSKKQIDDLRKHVKSLGGNVGLEDRAIRLAREKGLTYMNDYEYARSFPSQASPAGEPAGEEELLATLEEEHNCKTAHPGKTHKQWAAKNR